MSPLRYTAGIVEIDHVFICTSVGAPAAARLQSFGLTEGPPNTHPGQGTACRRVFFQNAMLELIWVADSAEAQSPQTRDTMLWERWSATAGSSSPFGIILRPAPHTVPECPFPSWIYRPPTMPDLRIHIAAGTGIDEPMWCFVPVARIVATAPVEHPAGIRNLTSVRLISPALARDSITNAMRAAGVIEWEAGATYGIELEFDHREHGREASFEPDLPLRISW